MNVEELRRKHPLFVYDGFETEKKSSDLVVRYTFRLEPNIVFHPSVTIPLSSESADTDLNALIFSLGMVEAISYWKAACSPKIIVRAGTLNDEQIAWWRDLCIHGLGEFFYRNSIDFTGTDFLSITSSQSPSSFTKNTFNELSGDLVMVGGGKDSIVTLETLRRLPTRRNVLLLNPTPAAISTAKTAGYIKPLIIKRTIDPQLLILNKQGYVNGHTPFSAYLAFLGTLVGAIYSYRYVIASNELSAGEGNVIYHDLEVNHQYSKSFRFEKKFREYVKTYLHPNIEYFSFLRPLYELQIAKLFVPFITSYPQFCSCNVNRGTSWCGTCAKCAFVYLSLFPFLEDKIRTRIFGKDFFNSPEIQKHVKDLVGLGTNKPFECVGTTEESVTAVLLSIATYEKRGLPVPEFFKMLQKKLPVRIDFTLLTHWGSDHFVPPTYEKILRSQIDTI